MTIGGLVWWTWGLGMFVTIGFLAQQVAEDLVEPSWAEVLLGILLIVLWPFPAAVLLGVWLARRFNATD